MHFLSTLTAVHTATLSKKYKCNIMKLSVSLRPPPPSTKVRVHRRTQVPRRNVVSRSFDADVLQYGLTHTDIFVNSIANNFVFYQLSVIMVYRGILKFSWEYTSTSLLLIEATKTLIEANAYINH